MTEAFTEREREILRNGASNQEYHYLGSAKIIGQISKAFAEAIYEMGNLQTPLESAFLTRASQAATTFRIGLYFSIPDSLILCS